jgi:DNA-binding GntR family transcriptional regulator
MTKAVNLAIHLSEQIEAGRYKVGQALPTEAELQQRFDVSRHTVREALRDLKSRGLVLARPGIGTLVRSKAPQSRLMQGIGTLKELIQFVEATRMKVLKRRVVIADGPLAAAIAVKPGQEWHVASVLRFLPRDPAPVAWMSIYVRPEHVDVLDRLDKAGQPVFALIERHHGIRIAEVLQEIVAIDLDAEAARTLKARAGAPSLHISRQYFDARDRLVMASVGLYPSNRFSHNTRFRIQNADDKESA